MSETDTAPIHWKPIVMEMAWWMAPRLRPSPSRPIPTTRIRTPFRVVVATELNFEAFRDADGFADSVFVRFLRSSDQVQLGAAIPLDMTFFDARWNSQTTPVEVEAIGESIIIEFNFVSDSSPDNFSGLSIDNILVDTP